MFAEGGHGKERLLLADEGLRANLTVCIYLNAAVEKLEKSGFQEMSWVGRNR